MTAPDTVPGSRLGDELVVFGAVAAIAVAAALVAHGVRELGTAVLESWWGDADPTRIVSAAGWPVVVVVLAGVAVAAAIGRRVARTSTSEPRDDLGLASISAAGRGESAGPSMRATLARASGTVVAGLGLSSLGRESAIVETSGALGSVLGRRLGRAGPALAAGGVAAGFAAAYHAPIAAVLYAEEHLRVRHDRRTAAAVLVAALVGHATTVLVLDGRPIFSGTTGSRTGMLALAAVVLVPAALASRGFLVLRDRVDSSLASGGRLTGVAGTASMLVVAALVVATVPLTSGNGMEAIRHASAGAGLGIALALAVGKLAATTATLGSGAPGGVFSPTLAVSAGWALLTFLGLEAAGVTLPGSHWDGMLVAMTIGIAVGLRAPLVALVVVPEMVGDLSLLPITATAVALALGLDRAVDRLVAASGARLPDHLHPEDS